MGAAHVGAFYVGAVHVVAACTAMAVGIAVLSRRKGDGWHVGLGRVYVTGMLVVNVAALLSYEATGRPGPFHVLAVISIVTTLLGWLSLRGRRRGVRAVAAHASFMTWSWIGVVTAGLAQLANQQVPQRSPWPVLVVVGVATAIGVVCVPRAVARQLRRQAHHPR